jgi:hypothetical protein
MKLCIVSVKGPREIYFVDRPCTTHEPSVTWPSEFQPPGHVYKGSDLQRGSFLCKLEELATGTTKHFYFTPEELPVHQVWNLIEIENTGRTLR